MEKDIDNTFEVQTLLNELKDPFEINNILNENDMKVVKFEFEKLLCSILTIKQIRKIKNHIKDSKITDRGTEILKEGCKYYNEENYIEAYNCFKKIYRINIHGMYNLGLCFFHGNGCEKNIEKAFKYFLKSKDLDTSGCVFI